METKELYKIETSSGIVEVENEKQGELRARELRRQELDVFLIKEIYNKKGKLINSFLIS